MTCWCQDLGKLDNTLLILYSSSDNGSVTLDRPKLTLEDEQRLMQTPRRD